MRRLRWAALLLLPMVTVSASGEAGPAAEDSFVAEMQPRLQATLKGATLARDPGDRLAITVKGGALDGATVNLHRIFHYCSQASAKDCEDAKSEFAERTLQPPPEMTAASLRLIVRDAQYMANVGTMLAKAGIGRSEHVTQQIGEDLYAILASDSHNQIGLVTRETLAKLKLSESEAWGVATLQTRAVLPPLPKVDQLMEGGVGFEDEGYMASMLIDRDGWAKIADAIGPDLVVTAVSDQFVLAGKMKDGKDLAEFKKSVAEDCLAQQRCVSPNVYRFREGRWVIAR
jgi:hypothetical protein